MRADDDRDERSTRNWLRIDLLIAISALFISALTAAASLYQTHVIADQLSSSVWPYLGFSVSKTAGGELSLAVENNGLGPAIIRTVELNVDGKPIHDLATFFALAKGKGPSMHILGTFRSLSPGDVVRPGELRTLIDVKSVAFVPLIASLLPRAELDVCYCSLLEQCWTIRSDAPTDYPEKTGRCGKPGRNELQIGSPLTP